MIRKFVGNLLTVTVAAQIVAMAIPVNAMSTEKIQEVVKEIGVESQRGYWMVDKKQAPATIREEQGKIILNNGIIERTIDLSKNGVTTSFKNIYKDWELLDGIKTEAIIGLDGTLFKVGGEEEGAFKYKSHTIVGTTGEHVKWQPKDYISEVNPWPALGSSLEITYEAPKGIDKKYQNVEVVIRYELYQGIPVINKQAFIKSGEYPVKITYLANDQLDVEASHKEDIYIETDYNGGSDLNNGRGLSFQWDSADVVTTRFDMGPNWNIEPNSTFESFRTYELLHSVEYYEWKSLEIQNMYRIVAPWINEDPLFLHLISDNSNDIRKAVDSVDEVGFDMIIQSFGSGINMESTNQGYIDRVKSDYDYAHSKGIDIGGYTLAVVKDYGPINGPEAMNGDPNDILRCLATNWSEGYWNNIKNFIQQTGTDIIEIDGPYHFYECNIDDKSEEIKAEHQHEGKLDSRYAQWKSSVVDMYDWLRENDVYINAPDWMFLNGTNKAGIGYEEVGWSQPRQEQLVIGRLYNYRGTYLKAPSMGWSFLPIDQYHGGGEAATFEPLNQNIEDYEWAIAQAFASGVQPAFRGRRLFDTEETKGIVKYWVDVYKRYKKVLNANTIHFLAPEQDPKKPQRTTKIDGIMQQTNREESLEKGFMMLFNQTDEARTEKITVPLYFTGLTELKEPPMPVPGSSPGDVKIPSYGTWPPPFPNVENDIPSKYPEAILTREKAALYKEGKLDEKQEYTIDSNGNIEMYVTIPPMSFTWYTIYDTEAMPEDAIPYPGKEADKIVDNGQIEEPSELLPFDSGAGVLANNTDAQIQYEGAGWQDISNKGYIEGDAKVTDQQGDSVEITFTGTDIDFYTEQSFLAGKVEVWLDGRSYGILDLQQSDHERRKLAWKITELPYGEHTVKLINQEGKLSVDAFVVTDRYSVVDFEINGKKLETMSLGGIASLAFTPQSKEIDLSEAEITYEISEEGLVKIDEINKMLTVGYGGQEVKAVTITPTIVLNGKKLKVNSVKVVIDNTFEATWEQATDQPQPVVIDENGVMTAQSVGRDNFMIKKGLQPTSGSIEAEVRGDAGSYVGVVWNYGTSGDVGKDKGQAQRAHLNFGGNTVAIDRSGKGNYTTYQMPNKIEPNEWYKLKVDFEQGKAKVYVNEELVIDYENNEFNVGGRLGFFVWSPSGTVSQFKNLNYTPPVSYTIVDTEVTTTIGESPVLPEKVTVTDGSQVSYKTVVWETIEPGLYEQEGTFEVYGSVEGLTQKAKAIVTVVKEKTPEIRIDTIDNIKEGETFEVIVSAQGNTPIYSQDITLHYDTQHLTLVDQQVIAPTMLAGIEHNEDKSVRMLIATEKGDINGDGNIKFTFRANEVGKQTTVKIGTKNVLFGLVNTEEGTSTALPLASIEKNITIIPNDQEVDKTLLNEVIREAESLSEEAVVGEKPGQYPSEAKETFDLAIQTAKQVANISGIQQEIDEATFTLRKAIETFLAASHKEHSGDITEDGKVDVADLALVAYYYQINSGSDNWEEAKKADVNKDKQVDVSDLTLVAQKILGIKG